jgi:hypothetical protein
MGDTAPNILLGQSAIEMDRGMKIIHQGSGLFLEPPTPGFLHVKPP